MKALKTIALGLATAALMIVAQCKFLAAQSASAAKDMSWISIRIAMTPTRVTPGQTPLVTLSVQNISDQVLFDEDDIDYRVSVEGERGQPPKTLYHRRLRGEAGLPPLAGGGPTAGLGIKPGESRIKEYNLTKYYDLSAPGKYSVYVEVRDKSGKWLRSNNVHFEILPPGQ